MLTTPGPSDPASLERPSSSQENYVQPNLGHGLRIWWAYYWPTSLISFFIIVVLAALLRRAWENDVVSTEVVLWLGGPMRAVVPFVSQVLIDGAVGLFVIYSGILARSSVIFA